MKHSDEGAPDRDERPSKSHPLGTAAVLAGISSLLSYGLTLIAFAFLSFGGIATRGVQFLILDNAEPGMPGLGVMFAFVCLVLTIGLIAASTWLASRRWKILVAALSVVTLGIAAMHGIELIQTRVPLP